VVRRAILARSHVSTESSILSQVSAAGMGITLHKLCQRRVARMCVKAQDPPPIPAYLADLLELCCGKVSWFGPSGTVSSIELLTSLASPDDNVAFPNRLAGLTTEALAALAGKPALVPFLDFICDDILLPAVDPERTARMRSDREQATPAVTAQLGGYKLVLIRSALLAAKLAFALRSQNQQSIQKKRWLCLHQIQTRLQQLRLVTANTESTRSANLQQEEQLLSKLLVQMLMPVVQQGLRSAERVQSRACTACDIILNLLTGQKEVVASTADEVLASGMCGKLCHMSCIVMSRMVICTLLTVSLLQCNIWYLLDAFCVLHPLHQNVSLSMH